MPKSIPSKLISSLTAPSGPTKYFVGPKYRNWFV